MARYSAFLGRRVEVQYRAGDILLPASGTFVADSGRSIFLEQQFEQKGQHRHFRWEIPYQCIIRLEDKAETPPNPVGEKPAAPAASTVSPSTEAQTEGSATGSSAGGAPTILPMQNRPKTA